MPNERVGQEVNLKSAGAKLSAEQEDDSIMESRLHNITNLGPINMQKVGPPNPFGDSVISVAALFPVSHHAELPYPVADPHWSWQ